MTVTECVQCGTQPVTAVPMCSTCLNRLGLVDEPIHNRIVRLTGSVQGESRLSTNEMSKEHFDDHFSPTYGYVDKMHGDANSSIYKVRDHRLNNRLVAMKVLQSPKQNQDRAKRMFLRELMALASLQRHTNIVELHQVSESESGLVFALMEFIDGVSLDREPNNCMLKDIVMQTCDALQFARDRGVAIRDLQPRSVMIDSEGRAKLTSSAMRNCVHIST